MKRRLALLPLLLAALPACAGGFAPPADTPETYYESSVPLRARLMDGAGGLSIQMNRPAHVAVFEVVPGRGMGLMYPSYGGDRSYISSGFFRLTQNRLRPYTWYYAADAGYSASAGPRYYLLVASRAPLRIDRFQDDPAAMRQWFGLRRFASLNPRPAMDELVETVVPAQADEDWDTDLLTVWPQDSRALFDDGRLVRVVCNNGVVVTTTWESAHVACRLFNHQPPGQPVPQQPDTLQPPASDSLQVPTRRRPEPRSTDETMGGRVMAPRGAATLERWRAADEDAPSEGSLRRPHARPVEQEDGAGNPVVRRVPPRVETDAREGERDSFRDRGEVPRGRPGTVERGEREARPVSRPEAERSEPRREAPRAPAPRRETPREAPARAEPSRPQARPEALRAPAAPTPAAPRARGGDPR